MPLFKFGFICEGCGKQEDRFFKNPPPTIVCSSCSDFAKLISRLPRKTRGGSKTIYSRSMGVHPDQIPEMERIHPGRKYAPDGRLEVKGFEHQKKLAKEHNMVID